MFGSFFRSIFLSKSEPKMPLTTDGTKPIVATTSCWEIPLKKFPPKSWIYLDGIFMPRWMVDFLWYIQGENSIHGSWGYTNCMIQSGTRNVLKGLGRKAEKGWRREHDFFPTPEYWPKSSEVTITMQTFSGRLEVVCECRDLHPWKHQVLF